MLWKKILINYFSREKRNVFFLLIIVEFPFSNGTRSVSLLSYQLIPALVENLGFLAQMKKSPKVVFPLNYNFRMPFYPPYRSCAV